MLKLIVIIIIVILALSYFQVDLRGIVESPQAVANFSYLKSLFFDFMSKIWPK